MNRAPSATHGGPCVNTDREIYREKLKDVDDYYADSIHVTEGGGIGINCGGSVYVKPLREWHRLAGGPLGIRMDRDWWREQGIEACLDRMQIMGDELSVRSETAPLPYVDRGDAVNLARNRKDGNCPLTDKGIDMLADAVLRMDAALKGATPSAIWRSDYEEVLADHRRLVRELDALLNNGEAAEQASLCDLVAQAKNMVMLPKEPPESWFRPFIMCPADEVLLAWQAFLMLSKNPALRKGGKHG